MSSNKQRFTVIGFQYEPEHTSSDINNSYQVFDDREEAEEVLVNKRVATNISEWCHCGNCKPMTSEKENVCCTDIDAIKYFHLTDGNFDLIINCIE